MRPAVKVTIDKEVKEILEGIANSRTAKYCLVERAKIILLASENKKTKEIAEELGIHGKTVSKWRGRWPSAIIEHKHENLKTSVELALADTPRPGQPSKYNDAIKCQIFKMACERPEDYDIPITRWTLSELRACLKAQKDITVSKSRLCVFLKGRLDSSS